MARKKVSQAWIELLADDPEALSALAVARERISAARHLIGLRRLRVLELSGALPDRDEQETLLHRSIQFYNPNKERCTLRLDPDEPAPLRAGEQVALVTERGGERRTAAERWWRLVTNHAVEVREGTAWAMMFEKGHDAAALAREIVVLRDRRHGLLCNPISQEARFVETEVPIPFMKKPGRTKSGGAGR